MSRYNTFHGSIAASTIKPPVVLDLTADTFTATTNSVVQAADYVIFDFKRDGISTLALNFHPVLPADPYKNWSNRGASPGTVNAGVPLHNVTGGPNGFGSFYSNVSTLTGVVWDLGSGMDNSAWGFGVHTRQTIEVPSGTRRNIMFVRQQPDTAANCSIRYDHRLGGSPGIETRGRDQAGTNIIERTATVASSAYDANWHRYSGHWAISSPVDTGDMKVREDGSSILNIVASLDTGTVPPLVGTMSTDISVASPVSRQEISAGYVAPLLAASSVMAVQADEYLVQNNAQQRWLSSSFYGSGTFTCDVFAVTGGVIVGAYTSNPIVV